MTFLALLKTLQQIRKRPNNEDLDKLIADVQQTHGREGVQLLHKVLIGLGLKQDEAHSLQAAPYLDSIKYGRFYAHSLYQKLLPLCQLAYLSEKNGIAEEHAFKLGTMFINEHDAMAYLVAFKEVNSCQYLLHDACLFDLPDAEHCDFAQWRSFARIHLANPRFRELLPHAEALEEQIGHIEPTKKKFHLDRNAIKQKKQELAHASKQYKERSTEPVKYLSEAQRKQRPLLLMQLSKNKSALRIELATLCQGLPLGEADMLVLEAFYERYQHNQEAHQLLIKNGISAKHIALFNTLKRANDDTIIPNIMLDGQELGYPELYLKKLDTLSDKGAALAACLGKITNCCQYIGGAGNDCAVHGITSPNGGFYVVCRGNASQTSLDDPIVAQSWVWKGKKGGLCLDSIESTFKKLEENKAIIDLFRLLGHRLCQKYDIPRVNTGNNSGITKMVGVKNNFILNEYFLDYKGYCDSNYQLSLANKKMPYLLYGQSSSLFLENIITQETQRFLSSLLETHNVLTDNMALKQTIAFILQTQPGDVLTFLSQAASNSQNPNHKKELEILVNVNQKYRSKLNKKLINIELIVQGAYVDMVNEERLCALHLAVCNLDLSLVKEIIRRGADLETPTKRMKTALFQAAKKGHIDIFNYLVKKGAKIDAIDSRDANNSLLIAIICGNQAITASILSSSEFTINMLQYQNNRGENALILAAKKGCTTTVEKILASPYCSSEILQQQNINNDHALMVAVDNRSTEIVRKILSSIHCHPQMLLHQNLQGDNSLILAVKMRDIKTIEAILESPYCTPEVLTQQNKIGKNTLMEAIGLEDKKAVGAILASIHYSPEILQQRNNYGNNALMLAAGMIDPTMKNNIVRTILASPHCNSKMLMQQNNHGNNALIVVAGRVKEIKKFEAILTSPHCCSNMLMQQNHSGNNVLIEAVERGNTNVIQAILASPYCSPQLLKQRNNDDANTLIMAAQKGDSNIIQAILASPHCTFELIEQLQTDKLIAMNPEIQNLLMLKRIASLTRQKLNNLNKQNTYNLLNPNNFFGNKGFYQNHFCMQPDPNHTQRDSRETDLESCLARARVIIE